MVNSMTISAQNVVPVTIVDDADIHHWKKEDITIRLIHAVSKACAAETMLNCHFDSEQMVCHYYQNINLGLAIDTPQGLYVPVLKKINDQNDKQLRENLNRLKKLAQEHSIPAEDLQGATIMLSNFGSYAGRYATPIVIPPMVAIIGVGKITDDVVAHQGEIVIHKRIPLSITVDHRVVTGGEVARFLKVMIEELES